ncbi:MAG TPA: DMT family transporter [candidate division Zixibacteria bacterium]|nr:DMT family transporter [candidate division Zixibacteria bacterium]
MAYIYILAIFLAILSYSMLNVGMGLQKKGAASLPKINSQTFGQNLKNFLTNKTWLFGFVLVQLQWVLLVMALDFAPISLVTPMMSVGMIALVIFSYFYLKEPIHKPEIGGIIAIIIGIVIMGVTNPEEEIQHDLTFIIDSFSHLDSIIFLTLVFIISLGFIFVCVFRKYKNADILFGISAGITDALGAIFIKALMGGADFRDTTVIQSSVGRWEWWFFMILLIIFNSVATLYLQVAYQRGRAVIVAPIFAVLAMITPVIAGIIVFDDWSIYIIENTIWKMIGKIFALLTIATGAIILSVHSARIHKKASEEKESQEEVKIEEIKEEEKSESATIGE